MTDDPPVPDGAEHSWSVREAFLRREHIKVREERDALQVKLQEVYKENRELRAELDGRRLLGHTTTA